MRQAFPEMSEYVTLILPAAAWWRDYIEDTATSAENPGEARRISARSKRYSPNGLMWACSSGDGREFLFSLDGDTIAGSRSGPR